MDLHGPVKGIFFDLGWTLLCPVSGDWMFSHLARRYFPEEKLGALPQDRLAAAKREAGHYLDTHHRLSTPEEEYRQFYQYYSILADAFPQLGLRGADIEKVAGDKVYNTDNYCLFPDTLATLEALKGKYRLGIISDTWPSIVPVLERFGLSRFFDCATYSYTLGVYKPHPRMYQDALAQMGLPPEETVFIDDFPGNLEGARRAGVQPVLIQAKPGAEDTEDMVKIKSISGLLDVLP